MQKLSRPDLHPQAVETAEQLLTQYAPTLGSADLRRFALSVVNAAGAGLGERIQDRVQLGTHCGGEFAL